MTLLAGQRVLVTGGSRGLGLALVQRFAAEGARVAFTYTRDERTAEAAKAVAGEHGRAYRVSVLDTKGTAAMVAELEGAWGGLDVLVNNAGLTHNLPLALLEEEDFDEVMDVNVKGAFLTTKAVLRGMIRRRSGVVLFMGSLAGAIEVTARLREIPADVVVPGHGDVCGPEVFDDTMRYLTFLQQTAAAGHAAGLTPLEAARESDLGEFAAWLDPERIAGNLHRAYAEIGGAARTDRSYRAGSCGAMVQASSRQHMRAPTGAASAASTAMTSCG